MYSISPRLTPRGTPPGTGSIKGVKKKKAEEKDPKEKEGSPS